MSRIYPIYRSIIHAGESHVSSEMDKKRTLLVNYLAVVFSVIVMVYIPVVLLNGDWPIFFFVTFLLFGCFIPSVYLNHRGHNQYANWLFYLIVLATIGMISYFNIRRGVFLETQVIFFGLASVALFLFKGWQMRLAFLLTAGMYLANWYLQAEELQITTDLPLVRRIINPLVAFICLYIVGNYYKSLSDNVHLVEKQKNIEIQEKNEELELKQKQLKELLESLQKAQLGMIQAEKKSSLSTLIGGVAHEINNPLNFIYAGSNALKPLISEAFEFISLHEANIGETDEKRNEQLQRFKEEISPEELQQDIETLNHSIIDGAERIQLIIQNLRIFARMDENQFQKVHMHENIEAALSLLKGQIKGDIQLKTDFQEDLPQVYCLIQEVNQAFMHIVKNAIEAIDENGIIEIKTSFDPSSEQITITVRDNGHGIAKENLGRVFDPFYTTKDIGQGTGLGLAVSQSVIESHHGMLTVDSIPSEGTEVQICLPIYPPEK